MSYESQLMGRWQTGMEFPPGNQASPPPCRLCILTKGCNFDASPGSLWKIVGRTAIYLSESSGGFCGYWVGCPLTAAGIAAVLAATMAPSRSRRLHCNKNACDRFVPQNSPQPEYSMFLSLLAATPAAVHYRETWRAWCGWKLRLPILSVGVFYLELV